MRKVKKIFSLLTCSILISSCATTVQKRIMVTDSLSSNYCNTFGCGSYLDLDKENKETLTKECMKISYYKSDLDALLDNGAKIISAIPTEKVVEYLRYHSYQNEFRGKLTGKCIGTEYIIEGYQGDFDKLQ